MNKILMEQYLKKLNEKLSDIIYHFTYFQGLKNILEENIFQASAGWGSKSDDDLNRGKFFFFSTTRSKSRWYGTRDVNIVLDGRKLNQKYKGFAVDYWNYSTNPKDYESRRAYVDALKHNELEDRIVTDSPVINDARKYIKEIHCLLTYRWNTKIVDNVSKSMIEEIIKLCEKQNIGVWFYDEKQYYITTNKQNSINPSILEYKEEREEDYGSITTPKLYRGRSIAVLLAYKDEKLFNEIVKRLDLDKEDIKKFKKEIDEEEYNYFYKFKNGYFDDYGFNEYSMKISYDINNNRSNTSKDIRVLLDMLSKDMRRRKAKNLKEYIKDKLK